MNDKIKMLGYIAGIVSSNNLDWRRFETRLTVKGGVEVERRTVGRNCSVPFG